MMAAEHDLPAIQKKFSETFGVALKADSFDAFRIQLAMIVNELILHDLNKLFAILYRVDVHEEKLKDLLKNSQGIDAAFIIAEALIERQLQKQEARRSNGTDSPIPDDEKW
ncbi:MAG TPA: hypothetical protein VM012_09575 [Flavitalea sp.]|nr:hypothetical protein [Flavitalea sp.]